MDLAAFLVFFMQAGFAMVEAGFTRAKNACNILMKNLMDLFIGSLAFWALGFGVMFGVTDGFIGTNLFFFDVSSELAAAAEFSSEGFGWAFLIFQTVCAATAATIVNEAMTERTKFVGYLAYSIGICVIVYPIFGSWCWNGLVDGTGAGWLEGMGFLDFAGSTVVHSIGGWAALAGAIVSRARKGKPQPIPGHNIPMAGPGVFILWLSWFGFNPGSKWCRHGLHRRHDKSLSVCWSCHHHDLVLDSVQKAGHQLCSERCSGDSLRSRLAVTSCLRRWLP